MFVVEAYFFERLSPGGRPRDHVGHLTGNREITAAVVAQIEHEVVDTGLFELGHRVNDRPFRGRDVIVEQHVADRAGACLDGLIVLHWIGRDNGGREPDRALRAGAEIPNLERVGLPGARGKECRIQRGCTAIRHVGTVYGEDASASTQVRSGRR